MTTQTCHGPECDRPATSTKYGVCRAHLSQIYRGRNLTPLQARTTNLAATCTVPGCTTRAIAKDLCNRHYLQSRTVDPATRCTGPDCDRAVEVAKHGLCKAHTKQLHVRGGLDALTPLQAPRGRHVDVTLGPDCHPDRPYYGRGKCRPCYVAARRKPRTETIRLCDFDGCDRIHSAHGWCSAHAYQAKAGRGMYPIGSRSTGPKATGKTPRKSRAKKPANPALPDNWGQATVKAKVKPKRANSAGAMGTVDFIIPILPDHIRDQARRKLIARGAGDLLDMLGLEAS